MFEFAHSELDIIKNEQDDHSNHDYCNLVDGVSVNTSNHKSTEINKFSPQVQCYSALEIANVNYSNIFICNVVNSTYLTSGNIFILNSSLLI